jgi:RecB family exonuclease
VLERQSACPFRAFAEKRLGARDLNRSEWGLTPAERGNLLHDVLRRIWSPEEGSLHTLDDLLTARRESRLRGIVEEAIAAAFVDEFGEPQSDDAWLRAYLDGERKRLRKRVLEWLEIETTRTPFTVIACEERLEDVNVGGLKLRLRADRIDEVADYARLLLDYKTGAQVKITDWNTPRPSQPQLPLYAAFGNVEDVCGVVFARIRAGETCMVGKVKDAKTQLCPDVKSTSALLKDPYSDLVRDEWTAALLSLAQDFLQGEAAVDPNDGRKTCEYCPLPGFCRVAERPAALDEDDTESADV